MHQGWRRRRNLREVSGASPTPSCSKGNGWGAAAAPRLLEAEMLTLQDRKTSLAWRKCPRRGDLGQQLGVWDTEILDPIPLAGLFWTKGGLDRPGLPSGLQTIKALMT